MAETLKALILSDEQLRSYTRQLLTAAVEQIRRAGVAQRVIRDDITATDILMALAGSRSSPGRATSDGKPSGCSTCL
jgi:hypothetical protein